MNRYSVEKRNQLEMDGVSGELSCFMSDIHNVAHEYLFISATERRCFNLCAHFLPDMANLVSNSGLLLRYKAIVDYYIEHGRFPRILIVDDIMVHGRGISKLIQQLEELLFTELKVRECFVDEDRFFFRYELKTAVDIWIFARSRGQLLVDERYLSKIKFVKSLYPSELRELSQQLSELLVEKEVANTSFVYSIRNKKITDVLEEVIFPNSKQNNWIGIPWKYNNENMIVYVRLFGNDYVKRISTIRFFPDRSLISSPQLTSFSIFGEIKREFICKLSVKIQNIIGSDRYPGLYSIFGEKDYPVLLQVKCQLLSFLLSVIDMYNFCKDINLVEWYEQNSIYDDLYKIAWNFGNSEIVLPELQQLINDRDTLFKIEELIIPEIDAVAESLIDVSPDRCESTLCFELNDDFYSKYNRFVERIFYYVGAEAEKHAKYLSEFPKRFRPEEYQNLVIRENKYGKDGVISFADFWNIVRTDSPMPLTKDVYFYLAAYIAIMDNGIMGSRMHCVKGEKLIPLSNVGEMAMFYYPRLFSMYIPAFSRIEFKNLFFKPACKKDIISYFKAIQERQVDIGDELKDVCLRVNKDNMLDIDQLSNAIDLIYTCGQNFEGWNFENMTKQDDDDRKRVQKALVDHVEVFLGH